MGRQIELDLSDRGRHGGRRRGAGRKSNRSKGRRTRVAHVEREAVSRHYPMHVTLRFTDEVGRVRRRDGYQAVRQAMIAVLPRVETFRICQVSIQANHVHLIVEADDRVSLRRGMTSFETSVARRVNAALGRRGGSVFADRFHVETLGTPTQVRNALGYVLNNWRKHGADRGSRHLLDPFASGRTFDGFAEHQTPLPWLPGDEPLPIAFPRSYLLEKGWRRLGLLSARRVPGRRLH